MNAQHHHGWKLKGVFLLAVPSRSVRLAYPAIVLAVWSFSQDLLWPGMLQAILLNVNAHCRLIFGRRINLRMFSFCFTSKTYLFKSLFGEGLFFWNERVVLVILLCNIDFSISGDRKFSLLALNLQLQPLFQHRLRTHLWLINASSSGWTASRQKQEISETFRLAVQRDVEPMWTSKKVGVEIQCWRRMQKFHNPYLCPWKKSVSPTTDHSKFLSVENQIYFAIHASAVAIREPQSCIPQCLWP